MAATFTHGGFVPFIQFVGFMFQSRSIMFHCPRTKHSLIIPRRQMSANMKTTFFMLTFFFIKMFNFHSLSVIKNLNTVESLLPSISVYKELLVECSGSNTVQVGVLQIQTHKRQV